MKYEDNREHGCQNKEDEANEEPSLYQVIVHNDDFTPMEIVVSMLEKFFYMDRHNAAATMYEAHTVGRAVCGIFSKDFAEAKVQQVVDYAKSVQQPLTCSMEAT